MRREDGFAATLATREPFALGQLTVQRESEGTVLVAGPGQVSEEVASTPGALRDLVRYDDGGRYRPLSGAESMPGGWRARLAPGALPDALDAIYPLAWEHCEAAERGELRVVGIDDVLGRQAGRYSVAAKLDAAGRRLASEVLCGQCVRVPVWRGDAVVPAKTAVLAIPCPEPCSVLVSLCREAALWQDSPPTAASPDPAVAFAAFESPGNEVREAYLAARR